MRAVIFVARWLAILFLLAALGLAAWLLFAPPELIRVAAGYTAKIVCSNVFVVGRDEQGVLARDVQAPGHPILGYISVSSDASAGTATAALFGLFGKRVAVHRAGVGCVTAPGPTADSVPDVSASQAATAAPQAMWPDGALVEPSPDARLAAILDDPAMTGPGMRAVVVVHDGRVVAERYGEGFSAVTPLLGWSMTKTVTAAIIGTLVREGVLTIDQNGLFEAWEGDARAGITIADLLAMSSGLEFNEDYGDVTDVTRMLYLEPDMASFAAAKPLQAERSWSYSSGTTVMLSRIWQDALGEPQDAYDWPRQALFGPLGMTSAVLEPDAAGTFVGSSYLYATARDWARFGQFLLQDGVWNDEQLLPEGYVAWMREEAPLSGGEYGRGHLWLHGPEAGTAEGVHPDDGFDLPQDAYWLLGHDGQSMVVIPSRSLVVVRLGLTPSKLGYKPQAMVSALATTLQ